LYIAYVENRFATAVQQKEISWEEFCSKLARVKRTGEKLADFLSWEKTKQDNTKDVGGFVAGWFYYKRRRKEEVYCRSCITLDMDYGVPGILERFKEENKYTCYIYSTHKHTAEQPRLRIIFPLTRPVVEADFAPLSKAIAQSIGEKYFDLSCYEANRLMFWPSVACDGEVINELIPGAVLNPEEIMQCAPVPEWQELKLSPKPSVKERGTKKDKAGRAPVEKSALVMSEAAVSSLAQKKLQQADPLQKKGIIGAYCRAHTPEEVLATVGAGIYRASSITGRYDYIAGEGSNGVVIYENRFIYSYHATDPLYGKLLNVFDFTLQLLFGKSKEGFQQMLAYCHKDAKAMALFNQEQSASLKEQNATVQSWQTILEVNKEGQYKNSRANICCILRHDSKLQGLALNEFTDAVVKTKPLPWHDNGECFEKMTWPLCCAIFRRTMVLIAMLIDWRRL